MKFEVLKSVPRGWQLMSAICLTCEKAHAYGMIPNMYHEAYPGYVSEQFMSTHSIPLPIDKDKFNARALKAYDLAIEYKRELSVCWDWERMQGGN